MSTSSVSVTLLLTLTPFCGSGQQNPIEVSLETSWQAYRQAAEQWRDTDKGLETDLLKAPKQIMLARIDAAESSALKFVTTRDAHYKAMEAVVKGNIGSSENITRDFGGRSVAEMKETMRRELVLIDSEREGVKSLISRINDTTDRATLRIWAEREREALDKFYTSLTNEYVKLERSTGDEAAFERVRKEVISNQWRLLESLQSEAFNAREDGRLWKEYYRNLRAIVRNNKNQQPALPTLPRNP